MLLSYVVITHNRRDPLMRTLARLRCVTPLPRDAWEVVVVDNASTDGTADAVAERFPEARLLRRPTNEGSAARNVGVDTARGGAVVFLDDDSAPRAGTVAAALDRLDAEPTLAMLGGRTFLDGGGEDGSALPAVPPACAMVVRRAAFLAVGGFCPFFFRQAEEHDLAMRMAAAGWRVERLESLRFDHAKVAAARSPELIAKMDVRNNLVLAQRHLPRPLRREVRRDWLRRYAALATHAGHGRVVRDAIREARAQIAAERTARSTSTNDAVAELAMPRREQSARVREAAIDGRLRRVVIADHSKTLFATFRACRDAGLEVAAIADNHPAYHGMTYRGVPILPDRLAMDARPDAVIVSSLNPATLDRRLAQLRGCFAGPIVRLWGPPAPPVAAPPRIGAVVLARMDSSRLPGKALTPILGRPLLGVVVDRLRMAKSLGGRIVVATSDRPCDDPIARLAAAEGVAVFRGEVDDVAGRFLHAAQREGYSHAFRVNADSPCVDAALLDAAAARAVRDDLDFVTNLQPRSFPYGVAVELVRTSCLASLLPFVDGPAQREHATAVVHAHLAGLQFANLLCEHGDLSREPLTIDTPDDLRRFATRAAALGAGWRLASYLDYIRPCDREAAA